MKRLMLVPITIVLMLFWAMSAPAQESAVGRVDLSTLAEAFGAAPKVNINFGSAMMAGFAETVRGQNPQAAEVLAGVTGLRVMVFEDVDSAQAKGRVTEVTARMAGEGWTPALEVRDDDANVDMFLIESGQFVKGLTVLILADDTAVFANIHGNLDPVVVGRLIAQGNALGGLDLDGLMGQLQGDATGDDG